MSEFSTLLTWVSGFAVGFILRPSIQLLWQIARKIWREAKAESKEQP